MRASKVGLLGLAIAAAFAAGAIAAPPHNNALEASRPHVDAALVLSPGAGRNVADIQRDIRSILAPAIADAGIVLGTLEQFGDFVRSFKQAQADGSLEYTREEMLDMKPGVVLDESGVRGVDREAVLALVDEWIDYNPTIATRGQVQP